MEARGPLKRRISKSASDLSVGSQVTDGGAGTPGPPTPSPSHSHGAPKPHSFLSALKLRWSRSRSKERKQKKKKSEDEGRDSRSTDYAADNSSEHSSSATHSPQHRQLAPETVGSRPSSADSVRPHCSTQPPPTSPPSLPLLMVDEDIRKREAALRQHSFFQLRVHLKRGVELVARDKGGTSDPYVKLKVGGRLLYKSKTIYRDLNPVWDEVFTVPIEDPFVPVHLKVFDYDWGLQDDFMGSVYIDLTKLDLGKQSEMRLELRDPNKTEYLGEILLTATLLPRTQEDKDQLRERARPKGDSGTLKKVKRKLTTLSGKSRDEEYEFPEDSDKETPKRRIKQKLVKLREKLGEELHEESESARERLKARIAKLNEKLMRDDDDNLFDDDETQEQRSLRIKHRIARLGEKLRRAPSEVEDGKEGKRLEGSSGAESQTSEERFDGEGTTEGTMLEKLGQRLKERSDQYFQRSARMGDVNRRLKSQIWSSVVTIVLVEGKNLQPMDIDGFSDPYIKFRLGNEKYKSRIVNKSLNPRWLEQFDLHLYDDQNQELELTVWDKDRSRDDFMGKCSIDLSALERERTHGIWRDLEEGAGSVFLLLTISGTTASETISDLTTHEENSKERTNILNRYALRNTLHNLRDVGHLTVKVYRATGLAAADLGGKSDPFCVLELVNARLQTQTEYKTLSPSWQKIFTFNVKDINSVLEVTVYDEDRDHKVEFLGKVAVPLLRIRNGEKKWYCLKDKKLRARAKGNCPMVLLEMHVVWNPVRAWVRTINPKEEKLMQAEIKFKRQVFVRNVLRLKAIIMTVIEWGKLIQDWFEWERPAQSAVALVLFITLCHYFEPYMILAFFLAIFLKYYVVLSITGGWANAEEEEEPLDDDDDDDDKDKEEKKSLKERLQAIQEVTQTVQNAIGYIASLGEQIKNTFNFTVPFLSWLAMVMVFLVMVVLYFVPMRYLIMLFGVNKFARKLLRPHTIPNNELLDLLSRVPDDESLIEYRELRPYSSNDSERRRERRRHKTGT